MLESSSAKSEELGDEEGSVSRSAFVLNKGNKTISRGWKGSLFPKLTVIEKSKVTGI